MGTESGKSRSVYVAGVDIANDKDFSAALGFTVSADGTIRLLEASLVPRDPVRYYIPWPDNLHVEKSEGAPPEMKSTPRIVNQIGKDQRDAVIAAFIAKLTTGEIKAPPDDNLIAAWREEAFQEWRKELFMKHDDTADAMSPEDAEWLKRETAYDGLVMVLQQVTGCSQEEALDWLGQNVPPGAEPACRRAALEAIPSQPNATLEEIRLRMYGGWNAEKK